MKRILVITLAALILSALIDLILGIHGEFAWSSILGFFALFGLVGGVAIVLIAKWLGHHWLQRKEDYYDGDDVNE